ncbi:hypothetical protein D1867_06750 [Acidianus infernus]|uniref:Calcineurin-like phosphoesterase domain-containing protein n=1 Tax=Acidianus infernus TaxID=12915 RepID=A0A6A9QGN0_ACIIN|nr:hypothetical protein [Acidianus infernus]MUM64943.1 hypothetical protein [Acidianus infernus]
MIYFFVVSIAGIIHGLREMKILVPISGFSAACLHGHIHESRAFDKIGKTIVLNPGSEFSEGILHAAYVVLEDGRVKAHQFIIG